MTTLAPTQRSEHPLSGQLRYLQSGTETDDYPLPLCRLRYLGNPDQWGLAIYLASKDGHEDAILPTGDFTGTPEQALDRACGLYLNDVTAWIDAHDPINQNSAATSKRPPNAASRI